MEVAELGLERGEGGHLQHTTASNAQSAHPALKSVHSALSAMHSERSEGIGRQVALCEALVGTSAHGVGSLPFFASPTLIWLN